MTKVGSFMRLRARRATVQAPHSSQEPILWASPEGWNSSNIYSDMFQLLPVFHYSYLRVSYIIKGLINSVRTESIYFITSMAAFFRLCTSWHT